MTERHAADVIVIGCGGFGSATLYHLARRGLQAVGIDAFSPPHGQGSSHGQTRIIRKAYFEHPDYVPLLHRAWDLWRDLEVQSQRSLLLPRPLLLSGPPGSEVTGGARQSARLHQLALDELTHEDARQRFPFIQVPEDHELTLEHTAGVLMCDACVETHLSRARSLGARLITDTRVRSINWSQNSVTVSTDIDTWTAGAAVVTAGAWTGQVLPEYDALIRVVRKTVFWHPAVRAHWARDDSPIFLLDLPEGQFYGLPSVDGRTIKVGEHTGGETVRSGSEVSREIGHRDRRPVVEFITRRLDGVHVDAESEAVCVYSMSPDGHFLFDRLPDSPVIVAAGFSGHGFKFTSVLGEAAADLVEYGTTGLPVEFLTRNRLHQTS